jgi:ubiquinone/menaquinone biosynthesis C-methylase UbiE
MTLKSQTRSWPGYLLNQPAYSGTLTTLFYNWPIFVGILFFGLVTLVAGLWSELPWRWLWLSLGSGSFVVMMTILLATYLVYDRGQQREYDRLAELGRVDQANVVLAITCGKLRGTRGLLPHFQQGHYFLIDIYDETKMTDQALGRARRWEPPLETNRRIYRQSGRATKLPVPHQWADVIYCDFSLHELPDPADRAAIFAEFGRVLKPQGRLLIAEHGRDWLNFLAFGPGVFSFFSPATWQAHIRAAGLSVRHHERWRGLVHLWVAGK